MGDIHTVHQKIAEQVQRCVANLSPLQRMLGQHIHNVAQVFAQLLFQQEANVHSLPTQTACDTV